MNCQDMVSYSIYTMASADRLPQLERFLWFIRRTNPRRQLNIIPFHDNYEGIREICEEAGGRMVEPKEIIDRTGRSLYTNEEYRPGVPAWRYFRKFNAFLDSSEAFIFLDCNALAVASLDPLMSAYLASERDILFPTHSVPGRTIPASAKETLFEPLNKDLGDGYNCSLMISKPGIIRAAHFKVIRHQRLRVLLSKAPEQGYMALLLAMTGTAHGLVERFEPTFILPNERRLRYDSQKAAVVSTLEKDKKLYVFKSTGSDLSELPEPIEQLKTALAEVPATKRTIRPSTSTDAASFSNQSEPSSQFTIKLYSPFRCGSNLVKALIETNFSHINVVNTGKGHWKHGFFAGDPTYYGYVICTRHPLALLLSIRDYYFSNGRNIRTLADRDNFLLSPVTIFDESRHRGRSPILMPSPIDLVNAWYANYLAVLRKGYILKDQIRYEDLVSAPEPTINRVMEQLGLPKCDNFEVVDKKTLNLGDERFQASKGTSSSQPRDAKSAAACGIAELIERYPDQKLNLELASTRIDWKISRLLGYTPDGLLQR